jgi:hypothetical protein
MFESRKPYHKTHNLESEELHSSTTRYCSETAVMSNAVVNYNTWQRFGYHVFDMYTRLSFTTAIVPFFKINLYATPYKRHVQRTPVIKYSQNNIPSI